jgi:arylsulfatase A-like enzyme
MTLLLERNRFQVSTPLAGLLVGLVVGFADWISLVCDWGNSQAGMWYLPPLAWVGVVWTSVTLCCCCGLLFSSPRLGRLRGVVLTFAGPGMFMLIRGARPLREAMGFSTSGVLLAWLLGTLLLSIPLALFPFARMRFAPLWLAGTALSAVVLIGFAARPDLTGHAIETRRVVAGPHNVVLVFLDTTRYDDSVGDRSPMPNLVAFARESVSFDNAWSPAPWTIPSHYSILTGADPWNVRIGPHRSGPGAPTLAQRFQARGFETAAILSNPLLGNPDFSGGFRHFTYSRASGVCRSAAGELLNRSWVHGGPRSPLCGWLTAPEVTSRAIRFVRQASKPYFLVLNYMDAHYPYYVPADCRGSELQMMQRAQRQAFRQSSPSSPASPALLLQAHQQYRAALQCMDRSLGTLLAVVGRDPDTIVVVVGDHGEQFGEHGLIEHGNSIYRQVLHVPLIMRIPARMPQRVADPVSATDVFSSILSTTGAFGSGPSLPIAEDRLRRPALFSYDATIGTQRTGAFGVARGDYHFILWRDGREALFDVAADSAESAPIPTTSARGATIAGPLRSIAAQAIAHESRGAEFRALGYLQ